MSTGLAIIVAAGAVQAEPTTKTVDPKADQLLRKMSTDLGAMKDFRFDTTSVMEVVTKEGEKLQGLAESSVAVERPNKIRADRKGPFGGGSLYYDGSTITFYGARDRLYAQAKAPDTIDAMVDFAREQLSIDPPGVDLLHEDPYKVLMEDVVSGRYMGEEPVGDRMCHHLAYRGNEVDWQIWVEDGAKALPCRMVITSKGVTGSPDFTVTMSNWKTEQALPADLFVFKPPAGAAKISFVTVKDEVGKAKQEARR